MPLTTVDQGLLSTNAQYTGFKNRLINGGMVIDQRNSGASVTPVNGEYTLDRWTYQASQASKITLQQNQGSVTPPAGFTNYLGITSSSAYTVGSAEWFVLIQKLEGFNFADFNFGTSNAQPVTVSFWVRSSLTGTFGASFSNEANDRSYPFSYTISAANTWTKITQTIPGDTSGTWVGASNAGAARLYFSLGVGSTYSGTAGAWAGTQYRSTTGATSVVGTNGATFYITGVQLEKGSTATSFDYRPYGTELQLCQRYYETLGIGCGGTSRGNTWCSATRFAVPKRASPTLAVLNSTLSFSNGSGTAITLTGSTLGGAAGISANGVCQDIYGTFSTSPTTGQSIVLLTDNAASVSAEL
jgi:hypothetical protein